MDNYRLEHDSMGEVKVPESAYWGAQTQRSLEHFEIGEEKMPQEIVRAFALVKKAAARANYRLAVLDERRCSLIEQVCDEILAGALDAHFPLLVWQTGSGTQSNMNLNEVIANRGNALAGENLLHPNDHVNKSQSSNDTFPAAMHVAAVLSLRNRLLPAFAPLIADFAALEERYPNVIKSGRTHLQDATPIRFAQEVSGWRVMLEQSRAMIENALAPLCALALGGTAVGTGLNSPAGFDRLVAEELAVLAEAPFYTAANKFHALTSKDAFVFSHGALKALAANLMKIANDVRWLASGPRCGLGEIRIPENEPGSSIMPGKVNPTQCEALTMVAVQVMGNDAAVGFAASQGNFELNVFMPVIAYNFQQSARLLADAMRSFHQHCASGIRVNEAKMAENMQRSLMLVTCLNPHIGYENAAKIAKYAYTHDLSLREAALALQLVTAADFDRWFKPEEMV